MSWLFTDTKSVRGSTALLLLRVVMGAAFILHGLGKINSPNGWMNWAGDSYPPYLQAAAVAAEFGGGIALILGLLTPLAALGLAVTMAVAVFHVHVPKGDVFVASGPNQASYELGAVYLACSLALLLLGPGRFSVDGCLSCLRGACATKCSATKHEAASAV
jgi:putative oxidoreductase